MKNKTSFFPALILLLFLIAGLVLIKDYGASADEHIQIQGGHVMWRYLCLKFHREVPEPLRQAPNLHEFKNSYYGQAATFPAVVAEAIKGFTLDTSTVVRIRHYWNFFCYFAGLCCFTGAVTHMTKKNSAAALWLLLQIFLPRIFGDIFYNDRDLMLMSWMMIFLSAFYLFTQRPGWPTSLLTAAVFAITVNTRIFGLSLLVFPALYCIFSNKRKYLLLFVPAALVFWFLISPIAWDDPLHTLPNAFKHFSTQQRALDTNNEAEALFFGKYYNETKLPWYYIPMYIVVTTPLATLIFLLPGLVSAGKSIGTALSEKKTSVQELYSIGNLIILLAVPLTGIVFHLTFYNGWRHFYFLCLPITWLSLQGVCWLWKYNKRLIRFSAAALLSVSFMFSAVWIIKAHPYQIIYLSPLFRSQWIGKLDRDYWLLSTTECMKYLLKNSPDTALNVVDKYAFIAYTDIGLPPQERERFHSMYHSAQPSPYEYLFFNYSGELGNNERFDYYEPVYAVTRDGIKLTEIFQRSHNHELKGAEIVETTAASSDRDHAAQIADNDFGTAWFGEPGSEMVIKFNREILLESFEIFPAEGSAGYHVDKVSVSPDGNTWIDLEFGQKGSNGISIQQTEVTWLKLESNLENQGIREILFYGH